MAYVDDIDNATDNLTDKDENDYMVDIYYLFF